MSWAGLPEDLSPTLPAGTPIATLRASYQIIADSAPLSASYAVQPGVESIALGADYAITADLVAASFPGRSGQGLLGSPSGRSVATQMLGPLEVYRGATRVPSSEVVRVSVQWVSASQIATWEVGWSTHGDLTGEPYPLGMPHIARGPVPAEPVHIRARLGTAGGWIEVPLLTGGFAADTEIDPEGGAATSSGLGPLALLVERNVSVAFEDGHGTTTADMVRSLAEAGGWNPAAIALPATRERRKALVVNGPPLASMTELLELEGLELYVDPEGTLTAIPMLSAEMAGETAPLALTVEDIFLGTIQVRASNGPTLVTLTTQVEERGEGCQAVVTTLGPETLERTTAAPHAKFTLQSNGSFAPFSSPLTLAAAAVIPRVVRRQTTTIRSECGVTVLETTLIETLASARDWHWTSSPSGQSRKVTGYHQGAFSYEATAGDPDSDQPIYAESVARLQPTFYRELTHDFRLDGWTTGSLERVYYLHGRSTTDFRRLPLKDNPPSGNNDWEDQAYVGSTQFSSDPPARWEAGPELLVGATGDFLGPEVEIRTLYSMVDANEDARLPPGERGALLTAKEVVTSAHAVGPGGTVFYGSADDREGSPGVDLQGTGPSDDLNSVFREVRRELTTYSPVGEVYAGTAQDLSHLSVTSTANLLQGGADDSSRTGTAQGFVPPPPARRLPPDMVPPTIQPLRAQCSKPGRLPQEIELDARLAEDATELTDMCARILRAGHEVVVSIATLFAPVITPGQPITLRFRDWPTLTLLPKTVLHQQDETGITTTVELRGSWPED